ncbi:MAG: hypothetical protein IJR26_04735 [Bacteroidales bacterium]|nr:hypothetical protein [Bacteroidales bacterium]
MRERARDKGRLEDIVEYSNNVSVLIEGHTFESFVSDKSTYYSVMKNVEIGENCYWTEIVRLMQTQKLVTTGGNQPV